MSTACLFCPAFKLVWVAEMNRVEEMHRHGLQHNICICMAGSGSLGYANDQLRQWNIIREQATEEDVMVHLINIMQFINLLKECGYIIISLNQPMLQMIRQQFAYTLVNKYK